MKAVLVIDMPENCMECAIGDTPHDTEWLDNRIYCPVAKEVACTATMPNRPEWCPLRQLPRPQFDETGMFKEYETGWNACLSWIDPPYAGGA